MRILFVMIALFMCACGGGQPRAEATWETQTTSTEDAEDAEDAEDETAAE
jgi:hypothetical protein